MSDVIILGTISLNQMAGGLEKNIILLANYLVDIGKTVELITFDPTSAEAFYNIHSKVKWHRIGTTTPHLEISFIDRLKLISKIRKILKIHKKNATLICFHHGIIFRFLVASIGLNIKRVCSERNSLSLYDHIIREKKWSLNFLLLVFMQNITVQFPRYVNDYPFWLRSRIIPIPNPVKLSAQQAFPDIPNSDNRFVIINVGRTCAQKNQDSLIYAFFELAHHFPNWDLHIVGDGPLDQSLLARIKQLHMSERIKLLGKRYDVENCLQSSHIFCFPSLWEGFPNALAEAMATGLPCVGINECAGVRDLIQDHKSGYLVNRDELADALRKLMSSHTLRKDMGAESLKIISQYQPYKILKIWENII